MKKLVIGILVLLLVGVAAYLYFHRDSDKARDVLPEDATSAMMFEPAQFIEGLGLDLHDVLKFASVYGDVEGAVDFTKPVYAFTSERGLSGISLNVKDAEKLLKSISAMGFASEQKQGYDWVANNTSIGCLDEDKLLILNAPAAEQDALRGEMMKLMKQARQQVPALNEMKQDGFLRLNTTLDKLPKEASFSLPANINLSDARLNAALGIGKKDITLSAALQTPQPLMDKVMQPIRGNLSGMGPAEPVFWLCTSMKGENLLQLLRSQPQLRTALLGLNMAVDVDMMLKAIDGDISIVVPRLDLKNPDVLLMATLSNTDFLQNADDWDNVAKISPSDFVATIEGTRTYFGVKNGLLYVANSRQMASQAAMQTVGAMDVPSGKYLYASFNAGQIIKSYPELSMMLSIMPQLRDAVEAIDGVTISADAQQNFELSLKTNKPVKDVISKLLKLLTGR